jgi:probable addiction module antidote protein
MREGDMAEVRTERRRKLKTYPWDVVDHLNSDEEIVGYLNAVLEEDDQELLLAALGDVARARGMTQVSRDTGLGRESLYRPCRCKATPNSRRCRRSSGLLGSS